MIAEQVRGNRAVLRDQVAVALVQPRPHVGMQRQVERLQLAPQAIELLRKRVGRHVVLRSPHRAGVREPQLARALVRELDEPGVALLHRRADRVPSFPRFEQPCRVPVLRQDLGDLFDVETRLARFAVLAELAASVHPFHRRDELRELRRFLRIRRRGHRQRVLQHGELAPLDVGARLPSSYCVACLGEVRRGGHVRLARARGHRLGVGRDVGVLHPPGLVRFDAESKQRVVRVCEERPRRLPQAARIRHCCRRRRRPSGRRAATMRSR